MPDNPPAQPGNLYRQLPSVDALLREFASETEQWGHEPVAGALRELLSIARNNLASGNSHLPDVAQFRILLHDKLTNENAPSLKPVLNLTGTVLHTNLGRASLPAEAIAAISTVAATATNLEFDLDSGKRGEREVHVDNLIFELTGAEAATVVNNNAAAVLLTLNTLALGRQVPVSRGELVEIGGSFRIPEVMQRSGCNLVEIGATNRTHLKDYAAAVNPETALLMKVHTSNYKVEGFTHAVSEKELASLAAEHNLPFVIDLGSGNLMDFAALGLPDEPMAGKSLANGADIITFSGDKLLGGPQAGIIAGRSDLVGMIRKNPLKRALRLDKMTLAGLAEILKLYRDPARVVERLPTLRHLTRKHADIRQQSQRLQNPVQWAFGQTFQVTVADCHSQIGSGSLPMDTLPSAALKIMHPGEDDAAIRRLSAKLRQLPLPIIGRIHKNALWLDLRCLESAQEEALLQQLEQADL